MRTQILLLLISISFFSCNSTVKNTAIPISNLDTDFPITEQLNFSPFHKYDILERGTCMVDDSILWFFKEQESNFGSCYNLNTGNKLSTIASKGRAAYEFTSFDEVKIVSDSVQFYTRQNVIKTFAKKDIIENVPMGDRKFSVTEVSDSILVHRMRKLPNGSVLATIQPALGEFQKRKMNKLNQNSVVISNKKEAISYETIKYESFNIEKEQYSGFSANNLIKSAYSSGFIGVKGNDMAVFSVSEQFILYTLDIKSGCVVNEKRYAEMQCPEQKNEMFISLQTINDRNLRIEFMQTSDKYILCSVSGYLTEKDKNEKLNKRAIFVLDWNLNPIKKFDLPNKKNGYYTISNNGNAVYFCEFAEDGLTLHKANLSI